MVFLPYLGLCLAFFASVYVKVPETKGALRVGGGCGCTAVLVRVGLMLRFCVCLSSIQAERWRTLAGGCRGSRLWSGRRHKLDGRGCRAMSALS